MIFQGNLFIWSKSSRFWNQSDGRDLLFSILGISFIGRYKLVVRLVYSRSTQSRIRPKIQRLVNFHFFEKKLAKNVAMEREILGNYSNKEHR